MSDLRCFLLKEMEQSGFLRRSHGGAAIQDHKNREVPFALRDRENNAAKDIIAKRAAALIEDGNTVFLDASSTVGHLTHYLEPGQNLTIITNSIPVLEMLKGKNIRCYLTGGMVLENSHALVGTLAENTISSLYADIFFSSQGISEDGIITDFSEDETRLRNCMIQNAKKSVFLYDHSKLGKNPCSGYVMQMTCSKLLPIYSMKYLPDFFKIKTTCRNRSFYFGGTGQI